MLIETNSVYSVNTDGSIGLRSDQLKLCSPDHFSSAEGLCGQPFYVHGLTDEDFATFLTIVDDEGVQEVGLLATAHQKRSGQTLITPYDLMIQDFDTYITEYLIEKIITIDPAELDQFSIQLLVAHLKKRVA